MTTLVTGATGFVGSNLVRALVERGERIRVLARPTSNLKALEGFDVERVSGDILDEASVARAVAGCKTVYHVAARVDYWRASSEALYDANVVGTQIVMEACLRAQVARVVHTSSVSAVGLPPAGMFGTEETNFDARSARFVYAHSKQLAEVQVQKRVSQGLPAVIVNPAIVVGPRDYSLHVSRFVQEFVRGHVFAVPPGGTCVADIDAVVAGEIAAAERGRVGERYILGGENLSYREIAVTLAEAVGRPAPCLVLNPWSVNALARAVDLANRVRRESLFMSGEQIRLSAGTFFYDSGKATRELKYPFIPFRTTVAKTYLWYRENGYLT